MEGQARVREGGAPRVRGGCGGGGVLLLLQLLVLELLVLELLGLLLLLLVLLRGLLLLLLVRELLLPLLLLELELLSLVLLVLPLLLLELELLLLLKLELLLLLLLLPLATHALPSCKPKDGNRERQKKTRNEVSFSSKYRSMYSQNHNGSTYKHDTAAVLFFATARVEPRTP